MSFRMFVPLVLLAVSACSGESAEKEGGEPEAAASAGAGGATATASSSATGGGAKSVKDENDLYNFSYSYPAEAGAIPALAAQLDADLAASRMELVAEAREAKDDAESNGFPYNPHYFSEEWKVVANLPGWLSLTGDFSTYTGGAHGMYGLESLVWDKKVGRGFPAIEMFESPEALDAALGDRLCQALDRERAKRREGAPKGQFLDEFEKCVGVDEATVLVGSANGRTFNRIGVWFGPYVAGPYAEGAYELNFAVDGAVLETVKPAYRPAFSIKR